MTRVKKLRRAIIARCFVLDPAGAVDALIAAVRRAERKRIWDKGTRLMVGIEDDPHVVFMVDAGEVDPKCKETLEVRHV